MIIISVGSRIFTLEKYLTVSKRRALHGFEVAAFVKVVHQSTFPYKVLIGIQGENCTVCTLLSAPITSGVP